MAHIMDSRATIPRGWECPKCRVVYAPWMFSCLSCALPPTAAPDRGPAISLPADMANPGYLWQQRVSDEWAETFPGLECRLQSAGECIVMFRLTPPDGQARD